MNNSNIIFINDKIIITSDIVLTNDIINEIKTKIKNIQKLGYSMAKKSEYRKIQEQYRIKVIRNHGS